MTGHEMINSDGIQGKIHTIRGLQVMLDNDLAELYQVEAKNLNRAVKRNIERFPVEFMFQLTSEEHNSLRFQIGTLNNTRGQHRKYLPFAFTEQGVSMLSAVLRSETAVQVSIQIMNAFVAMRRFIASNAQVFQRIVTLEVKQVETDKKIDKVLNAIESKDVHPKQGIFFNGQIFDAYRFVSDLFRAAKESIVIIDNYIDDTVLTHLAKRRENVTVTILTKTISK
jgi:phage regulator Rha-like protein